MATEVKIPALGESITTGIIAAWHVKNGDVVKAGQLLYDLETDKITSEGHAEVSGKIKLLANEGDEVNIGQAVASIDESVQSPRVDTQSGLPSAADKKPSAEEEKPLSPAVRRLSEETHIDPAMLMGSGKGGRVTKGDMLAATHPTNHEIPRRPEGATSAPIAAAAPKREAGERTSRKKMSPMRARIAQRLVQAKEEAAMLTTFNEVDMSHVMETRKKYQDEFTKKHNTKLGFMSFFIKATVKALQDVPEINAQLDGDYIVQNHFYDIGVAVGGAKGLVVPVIRDCDHLAFHEVEQSLVNYAKKAREGKITIDDMQGGVFTISNGGIYGSMLSTPIINPPQSAILGMHAIKERAVVVNGNIVIRPMMYLALSYDHRIVDGKEAVTFLNKIKESIEDPARILYQI
ncbi:MAG: dihydrolipoyllysine-residue succinyltransferase [Verrucomicrobia bacterium CG_4_10_14_3_um_filter_43_23]|nr:MAG: dihydrolipoamide succinyltransferase [Verrucomicrobia bacterium CG1_02_43_26]PIP59309.1 MAG: dihydrolipoyllysine-residue succinyltransferase [Verrucomicrobia bacterium CG22_combo_CG10-13_8_21_14_all_43_17]PIX57870.1 MAG: dihydrolipoyllysine-residue succinyltransferase [Verrucomicrobia bacterium CG_4_10_14_3_um_filter_43_23]PIY62309.1 MAG: dihydrolipoyllysine-residue succinyltransferase [Verrucomicrobia bacterium CG_4_10_14_0_8_um_filter_43_34]PJA44195.1 MAG: dihydrolipoyllysine-residue 